VFTNTHIYVVDDRSEVTLSEAAINFSQRYAGEISDGITLQAVPLESRVKPLQSVIEYFVDHVGAGREGALFGLELAVEVVKILSQCEGLLGVPSASLRR
jgi:hypothetical protein